MITSSDETESMVRKWALKRNGDPIDSHDIIELVLAVDTDAVNRTTEIEKQLDAHMDMIRKDLDYHISGVEERLDSHIDTDKKALGRIASHLESETGRIQQTVKTTMEEHLQWTEEVPLRRLKNVEDAIEDLSCIRDEHRDFHERHLAEEHPVQVRRESDPEESDFSALRTAFIGAAKQAAAGDEELGDIRRVWRFLRWIAILATVAGVGWFITFSANSCSKQKLEKMVHSANSPAPTVTVTVTPLP